MRRAVVLHELRTEAEKSGLGCKVLAIRAGLSPSHVSRFLHGSEMTVRNAEALADALGLKLILKRAPKRKGAG